MHILVTPAIGQNVFVHHFEQKMGASSRRMHFLACSHEAWAHHAAVHPTAFADPYAPQGGSRKLAVVLLKSEMRVGKFWMETSTEAKIVVRRIRINDLTRVHLPVWIPDRFELPEGLHQFHAEHLGKHGRPRLAVAVFARQRAAVG